MKFLDNFKNKNFGGNMIAHHSIPFGDASFEQIYNKTKDTPAAKNNPEFYKDIFGENADQIIREIEARNEKTKINPTNFKMPGEFPGTTEEFNQKYGDEGVDTRPNFMEIPVIPFNPLNSDPKIAPPPSPRPTMFDVNRPDEDDLAFLKDFINRKA